MEVEAACTNWKLFIGCVRSLYTKKAQGGGRALPCYSTVEGQGPEGEACQ